LIIFEWKYSEKPDAVEKIEKITWRQALLIGVFQSVAIIPGVSRAAATIVGGLLLGLKRKTIVEFSFLLAVPTMAAATGFDLLKSGGNFSLGEFGLLFLGFIFSFFTALIAIKLFLNFIKRHSFIFFGAYRVILAVLFWFLIW
jgi:undecaprenyl-diphosphatase